MEIKGKKIPNWVIPVVGVSVLALYLIKRKSPETGSSSTEPGTQGLSNQSFIPVTGENVAGVGAGNYGSSGGEGAGLGVLSELFGKEQETTREYMQEQREEQKNNQTLQSEFFREVLSNLGTGGGTPYTPPTSGGVVTAPPPGTAPVKTAPKPAPVSDPIVATIKCGNGCQGHKHKSGKVDCQVRNSAKKCVWP